MPKLSGGTVYDLSIHLVLVTKYRRKVINASILKRLEEIFTDTCAKWECNLLEFNGALLHERIDRYSLDAGIEAKSGYYSKR